MRMFELHRDQDMSGLSGTGTVAEGVEFSNGSVAMMWAGKWPTSVVFHERGIDSVRHLHGHDGKTRIVFLDTMPNPYTGRGSPDVGDEPRRKTITTTTETETEL